MDWGPLLTTQLWPDLAVLIGRLFIGNVDHPGHFGGLVSGGLLGYLITPRMVVRARSSVSKAVVGVAALALVGTVAAALVPAGDRNTGICAMWSVPPERCPQEMALCLGIRSGAIGDAEVHPNQRDFCNDLDLPDN